MEKKLLQKIVKAWNDEGRNPTHHRMMKDKLRAEWPALARALDELNKGAL